MALKIGINGFGRIGRNVLRGALANDKIDVVAINDLTKPETLAHLFEYDSVNGHFDGTVEATGDSLTINGKTIKIFAEPELGAVKWGDLGIDYVVESTGIFTDKNKAIAHIDKGGAKKVIISAPAKNEDLTIVLGVNENQYDKDKHHVVSNASCTTNCLAPVAKVLDDNFKIQRGFMTTVHSYTNDQRILDLPHSDLRRARAAAVSIIPTTTGAAKAVGKVLPHLNGKLDGMAMRVPTPNVSIVDFVADLEEKADAEAVNEAFRKAALGPMKGVLSVSEKPLVSHDFLQNPNSSIVDALSTASLDGDMVKVISWYDNEWGYSMRVIDLIDYMAKA